MKDFKLEKNNLFELYGNGLLKKHSKPCLGQKAMQKGYCFFQDHKEQDRDGETKRDRY